MHPDTGPSVAQSTRTRSDNDLGPGPFERAAHYLGVADDSSPLTRFTRPWWVRSTLFVVALSIAIALVVVGG